MPTTDLKTTQLPKTLAACADRLYKLKTEKAAAQAKVDALDTERKALEDHLIRNLPKGDVAALAKTIAAFSTLAHESFADVSEAEINPLLIKREGEGVVAVDGLVVLKASIRAI